MYKTIVIEPYYVRTYTIFSNIKVEKHFIGKVRTYVRTEYWELHTGVPEYQFSSLKRS